MVNFPFDTRALTGRALAARAAQAILGTAIIAFAACLVVRAELGLGPWNVVQQGLTRHLDVTLGQATWITGVAFLLCALALRQRPGPGTVLTMFFVGVFIDAFLPRIGTPGSIVVRLGAVVVGLVVMSFGGSLVISARLGISPLDALNIGLCQRLGAGWPLAKVRLVMEVAGVALGWWLGGDVGSACIIIGIGIGPCLQMWLRVLGHHHTPSTPSTLSPKATASSATNHHAEPVAVSPSAT